MSEQFSLFFEKKTVCSQPYSKKVPLPMTKFGREDLGNIYCIFMRFCPFVLLATVVRLFSFMVRRISPSRHCSKRLIEIAREGIKPVLINLVP